MTDNSSAVFQYSLGAIEENHGESVGDSFCWHLVRECGFYEGQFNCFCKMGLYYDGSMHLVLQYAVIFMFFLHKYIW